MRLNRFNLVLLGLLAGQLVLLFLVVRPAATLPTADSRAAGTDLWPGVGPEAVARIDIAERAEGDRPEQRLALEKGPSGWVLQSAGGYPVKTEPVDELLQALNALHTARLVAATEASHAELDIGDQNYTKTVTLADATGKTLLAFYVGRFAVGTAYVRPHGQAQVYEVDGKLASSLDTYASAWIDTQLLTFEPAEAKRVSLTQNGQETVLAKGDAGWTIEAPEAAVGPADETKVMDVVRALATTYVQQPIGGKDAPEYGFATPLLVARVTLGDGQTVGITVGAAEPPRPAAAAPAGAGADGATAAPPPPPQSDAFYARKDGSPLVVTLSRYKVEALQKAAADFRAVPAAAAAPGPAPAAAVPPPPAP